MIVMKLCLVRSTLYICSHSHIENYIMSESRIVHLASIVCAIRGILFTYLREYSDTLYISYFIGRPPLSAVEVPELGENALTLIASHITYSIRISHVT